MVPKYVIDVSIIWLNDNINSRNTDVQTQNIGKLRYHMPTVALRQNADIP